MIAFASVLLAIAYCQPAFSFTENALSDLGVKEGPTAVLFNFGLIISGVLILVFTSGLFLHFKGKAAAVLGSLIFSFAALALTAIGSFPENVVPIHYYASVAFFVPFPLSMLVFAAVFLWSAKVKMGLFTLLAGIAAIAAWIIQSAVGFGSGVAIPETIAGASASIWSIVVGLEMLRGSKQ